MVPMNFSYSKIWGQTPKTSLQHVRNKSQKFGHVLSGRNGQKWPFGHSGQSEVSENGPNEFLIPKNLGIDTKNKSLACSKPKLEIWPDFFGTNFQTAKKCLNIALIQKIRALYFLQFFKQFQKHVQTGNFGSEPARYLFLASLPRFLGMRNSLGPFSDTSD